MTSLRSWPAKADRDKMWGARFTTLGSQSGFLCRLRFDQSANAMDGCLLPKTKIPKTNSRGPYSFFGNAWSRDEIRLSIDKEHLNQENVTIWQIEPFAYSDRHWIGFSWWSPKQIKSSKRIRGQRSDSRGHFTWALWLSWVELSRAEQSMGMYCTVFPRPIYHIYYCLISVCALWSPGKRVSHSGAHIVATLIKSDMHIRRLHHQQQTTLKVRIASFDVANQGLVRSPTAVGHNCRQLHWTALSYHVFGILKLRYRRIDAPHWPSPHSHSLTSATDLKLHFGHVAPTALWHGSKQRAALW